MVEIVALRQQLATFKARGRRPHIRTADLVFWVVLRRVWSRWTDALVIVKPKTVVRWHRTVSQSGGSRLHAAIFSTT